VAGELEAPPGGILQSKWAVGAVQSAVLLRKDPLWSGGPGLVELEDRSKEESPKYQQKHEMNLIEPGMKNYKDAEELAGALVVSRS